MTDRERGAAAGTVEKLDGSRVSGVPDGAGLKCPVGNQTCCGNCATCDSGDIRCNDDRLNLVSYAAEPFPDCGYLFANDHGRVLVQRCRSGGGEHQPATCERYADRRCDLAIGLIVLETEMSA